MPDRTPGLLAEVGHRCVATSRRIVAAFVLITPLVALVGCSDKKSIGQPETVGLFHFQKFQTSYFRESGARQTYEYYEISYGRILRHNVRFPDDQWDRLDQVTRLPSTEPSWLIRVETHVALMNARSERVALEPLWDGDEPIQRIDDHRWFIPDLDVEGRYPDLIHRGGRLFNGKTLTQHWLPAAPTLDNSLQRRRFISISPDETSSAWFVTKPTFDEAGNGKQFEYQLVTTGGPSPAELVGDIDPEFIARNPLPDASCYYCYDLELTTPYQAWFDALFRWTRDAGGRWHVVRRG